MQYKASISLELAKIWLWNNMNFKTIYVFYFRLLKIHYYKPIEYLFTADNTDNFNIILICDI